MSRTVVPSREVYHLYAAGKQEYARNARRSASFDKDAALSYRAVIARRVRSNRTGHVRAAYLMGTRHYSVTTSKHQSFLRSALHGERVFYVADIGDTSGALSKERHRANLLDYAARIAEWHAKRTRARLEDRKDYAARQASGLLDEASTYAAFFGIPFDVANLEAERAKQARAIAKADAKAKRDAARRDAEQRAKLLADVPRWLAGEDVYIGNHPDTFLRAFEDDGEMVVETSRGARVPLDGARQLFAAWVARKIVPGMTVGDYTVRAVTDASLIIGCHELRGTEIARFAAAEGWAT